MLAVLSIVGVVLLAVLAKPLLVLFGGVLFALFLRSAAMAAARVSKLPYLGCLAAIVVAMVTLAGVAAVVLGPSVRDQLSDLAIQLPQAAREALDRFRHQPLGRAIAPDAAAGAATIASGAAIAVGTLIEVAGALAVIFFVGVYGAARPSDYKNALLAVVPEPHRERVRTAAFQASIDLTRWLLGRFVAMTFVGVTCAIAFALLRVPLALTLGVIAGLLAFVEYVGAIISAVPPVLLAFTRSPETALAVLVVYTVLHVIEGYVLTPLLARAAVRFPPALTLAGQILLASLVGPLGLTFSTPIFVVAVAVVRAWRRHDLHELGESGATHY
jgi:predicted PurR-regulated permease PerM